MDQVISYFLGDECQSQLDLGASRAKVPTLSLEEVRALLEVVAPRDHVEIQPKLSAIETPQRDPSR